MQAQEEKTTGEGIEDARIVTVRLADEDIHKLSVAIMDEFTKQFQLNVGKGILEYLWKAFLAVCIVALLWSARGGLK